MCNSEAISKSLSKERAVGLVTNPYKATREGLRDVGVVPAKKVDVDPAAERAAAEAAATTQANARIAFQRKAQRENSLITGGGAAAPGAGRSTLGV